MRACVRARVCLSVSGVYLSSAHLFSFCPFTYACSLHCLQSPTVLSPFNLCLFLQHPKVLFPFNLFIFFAILQRPTVLPPLTYVCSFYCLQHSQGIISL